MFEEEERQRVEGRPIATMDFEEADELNKVVYAKFCPYCGSKSVEAR